MAELMKGKRGLIMGVANDRSIAWGIARAMAAEGAELAFSYQGEAFGKRVEPLAQSVGSSLLVDVDVMNDDSLDAAFERLKNELQQTHDTLNTILSVVPVGRLGTGSQRTTKWPS